MCCWKRVFSMTSAFSWQKSINLCPASFRPPRPNLPVTRCFLTSYFCIPAPYNKRTSFLGVSSKRSCAFPGGSEVNVSARNAGDVGSIPGLGRSPGERNGNPLQYSCLENPMDGGAWRATVHGVAKSRTRLSDFTFTFTF